MSVPDRKSTLNLSVVEVMDDVKNIATINYHEDVEAIKETE
jgi:hypothetical protein